METINASPQDNRRDLQSDLQEIWNVPDSVLAGRRPAASDRPLYLLVAPRRVLGRMVAAAAARLCLAGPVRILDGGNLYDAYSVARMARLQTPKLDEALGRIKIARAFTCYQMEALLAAQQPGPEPLLGLDLLETFADENAPLAHRDRLAQLLVRHLLRLAQQALVLVGVAPASAQPVSDYLGWLERCAERTVYLVHPIPPQQPPLF